MKTLNKMRLVPLLATLLLVGMMAVPTMSMAAEPTVNLGTASHFAVLAGAGITNTGSTTITGNVGTHPTISETGFSTVVLNGTNHEGDAVTQLAKDDLVTAYNAAAGLPVNEVLTGQDLGGLTLKPGVYFFSSSAQLTGTLTLDGNGESDPVFVFQVGSTLTTASGSSVILTNGARSSQTFWQVGSSATLGTSSLFAGQILALTSITATTGATVQGELLARNGAVTLDTNTITNRIYPATLQSIAITHSAGKLVYNVGDVLDISGLEVTGTYSDGSQKLETVTTADISGFDSSTAVASQPLTITIGDNTTNYTIVIQAGTPGGGGAGGESFPIFSATPSYFELF